MFPHHFSYPVNPPLGLMVAGPKGDSVCGEVCSRDGEFKTWGHLPGPFTQDLSVEPAIQLMLKPNPTPGLMVLLTGIFFLIVSCFNLTCKCLHGSFLFFLTDGLWGLRPVSAPRVWAGSAPLLVWVHIPYMLHVPLGPWTGPCF